MFRRSLTLVVATMVLVVMAAPVAARHGVNGKACMINIADRVPGNASAAAGAKEAEAKLHVEVVTLDADTLVGATANIETFVTAGDCDLIIGGDFLEQIAVTQARTRESRLRRIAQALKVALP